MAGPGGMERCQVRVQVLAPRGVSLGAEEDHLCGSLEPVLDGGSNTWLAPTHGLRRKDGPWAESPVAGRAQPHVPICVCVCGCIDANAVQTGGSLAVSLGHCDLLLPTQSIVEVRGQCFPSGAPTSSLVSQLGPSCTLQALNFLCVPDAIPTGLRPSQAEGWNLKAQSLQRCLWAWGEREKGWG